VAVSKGNKVLDPLWDRVCVSFDKWNDLLELHWCNITLHRSDSFRADDNACAADTAAQWQYREATINVYLPAIAHFSDPEIEELLVHEMVHILVNSLESLVGDRHVNLRELSVENVARALIAVHRAV
jgi:hypothetical protein